MVSDVYVAKMSDKLIKHTGIIIGSIIAADWEFVREDRLKIGLRCSVKAMCYVPCTFAISAREDLSVPQNTKGRQNIGTLRACLRRNSICASLVSRPCTYFFVWPRFCGCRH